MPSTYDSRDWARATTLGRRVFSYNFRLRGDETADWTLIKTVAMHKDAKAVEFAYVWQAKTPPDRFQIRVGVVELADWRGAQKQLLTLLDNCMRPELPRATGRLALLGDVAFVAPEPRSGIVAALQFTRGNIAVTVNSVGTATADVTALAAAIDRALSGPPTAALRRRARTLPPSASITDWRQGASLVESLTTSVGDATLKVIAPDGEVRRRGDVLTYQSTEPGPRNIQMITIPLGGA